MDINYLQLGATFILAMALVEIIKLAITKLINALSNQNRQTSEELLFKISSNELAHIQTEIQHQTQQHDRMIEILSEISGKLSK